MWTWQSINPGRIVRPPASMTSTSGCSPNSASGPTTAMRSPSIRTLVRGRGAAPVPSITVAPRKSRGRHGGSAPAVTVAILEPRVEESQDLWPDVGAGVGGAFRRSAVNEEGARHGMTAGEDGRRLPGLADDVAGAVIGEVLIGVGV